MKLTPNKPTKKQTIVFIHENGKILLGMKKRGFGAGRWNGYGGKVEPGETPEQAAKREIMEEARIHTKKIEKYAIITFDLPKVDSFLEVHIFKSLQHEGEPKETEEMKPKWFDTKKLPYDEMWPDDKYWMPYFISGKKILAKFKFDENDEVLEHKIKEVEKL